MSIQILEKKKDEGAKKRKPPKRKEFRLVFQGKNIGIANKIIEIAKREHLKPTTLLKKWILEKLEEIEVYEKTIKHSKGPEEVDDPSML